MYGVSIGTLNIYIQDATSSSAALNNLFTVSGNQGRGWKQASVSIQSSKPFMIVIEGTVGNGHEGDLALDDISINPGQCPPSTASPPVFMCDDHTTISNDQVCDFYPDCPKGTDEANCGACNFDQYGNICGNTDVSSGSFQWLQDSSGTVTRNTGPTYDHTTNSATGMYMYVDASNGHQDDLAGLQTPTLHQSAASCQFTFWYHMYGSAIGQLSVSTLVGTVKSEVWSLSGNQGNQWKQAVVDIGRISGPFTIIVQAKRSYSVSGDIAVDDFNYTNCALPKAQPSCSTTQFQCANNACIDNDRVCDFTDDCGDGSDESSNTCTGSVRCDFSTSLCFWTQDNQDQFDWTRQAGSTGTLGTGPTRDHTTGLSTGYYAYIETSSPRVRGDTARLFSPVFQASSSCQFSFYYNMYGSSIGALNVYVRFQNLSIIQAWSKVGGAPNVWSRQSLSLPYRQAFEIIIEGVTGNSYKGDIGIDDTSFSQGCRQMMLLFPPTFTLPPTSMTTTSAGCNGYQCPGAQCITMDQVCDFNMDCADGSDEINCGACDFEHGSCRWADMSSGIFQWGQTGADGRFGPSADHTFGSGGTTGHYSYVKTQTGVFDNKAVLSSPVLPASSTNCEMHFFYNIYGDPSLRLTVTASINGVVTPVWNSSSAPGQNQWMEGTAYIGQKLGALAKGFTIRFEGQPSVGYRPSSSKAIAIDDITFTNCNPNVSLPTVTCNFDSDFCSWTNVANTDKFDWTRHSGTTTSSGTGPKADHTSGTGSYIYIETSAPRVNGDYAQLVSPRLPPTSSTGFCLSFYYSMFGPNIGSLNVYLTSGGNKTLFWSKTGPQADKWVKAQRTLLSNIDYQLIFEGVKGNGYQGDIAIDDIQLSNMPCPANLACDFQNDFCDWTQSTNDNFDWVRAKGGTSTNGTGPRYDHTFASNTGYYAYIETSSPRKSGDRAILVSPKYTTTSPQCFTFWYHMFGPSIGRLVVHQRDYGASFVKELWIHSGDHGDKWRLGRATVQSNGNQPYSIELVAYRGNTDTGDIAIDDVEMITGPCPPAGFCDFERDQCQWVNTEAGDDFDWERHKGKTPSNATGPKVDHTIGTEQGYYMFIEASGTARRVGEKAHLISDYQDPQTTACLSFWYYMFGSAIGSLNIYTKKIQTGVMEKKWSLSGNQGNLWSQATVNVPSDQQYVIIIEGVRGGNYSSDIAIDDVRITATNCSSIPPLTTRAPVTGPTSPFPVSDLDCTFELGLCHWSQDTTDDFDWSSTQGSTSTARTGPTTDHTLQNLQGRYMYIEVTSIQPNSKARLISNPLDWTFGRCFKFWFNMYGAHVNSLNVYSRQMNTDTLIWTKTGNQGIGWKYGQVYINQPGLTKVVIEGVAGSNYTGDIAIDDLSSNAGLCPPTSTCDFEGSHADSGYYCGYTQDSTDQFDWQLHSGTTGTSGTGPLYDHTYGTRNGHYVFIESSSPQHPGDKARLDSPVNQPSTSGSACITFWYSMKGRDIGTLNLYKKVGNDRGTAIWTLSGDQGLQWHKAQATVTGTVPYQISFEGVVGNGFRSDIAIDDINIQDDACPPPGSCNFERDLCDWTNSNTGDNFDWERAQGNSVTKGTGPAVDHTLNSAYGTYLYIEGSSPRQQGDKAWLVSTTFGNGTSKCLSFWYNMNGVGMGSLHVNMWPFNSGLSQTTIWSKSGNQGTAWLQDQVQVMDPGVDYRIVFEAVRGPTFKSDIAIDDIVMQSGACMGHEITTVNPCIYQCDGHCISSDQICDLNNDCQDGRDENTCGYNCNYENGTCKWVAVNDTNFVWLLGQGAAPVANAGPPIDHTILSPLGHYMFLDTSSGIMAVEGRYISPVLQQASATCEMIFYYHMLGTNVGHLYVYVQNDYQSTMVYRIKGDHGASWQKAVVVIGRQTNPFQIVFSAGRSFATRGDIAIDDISFQSCGYPVTQDTCGDMQVRCNTTRNFCIMNSRLCDNTDDCGDNSDERTEICKNYMGCTFEQDTCFWQQDQNDDFDWTRHAGHTDTADTGPTRDHTTNSINGHYMYIESSAPRVIGEKARLISPFILADRAPDFCFLRLYFNMYGNSVGALMVYTRTEVNGVLHPLWGVHGPKGDFFHKTVINVFNVKPVQLVIEASVGIGFNGDIAIDDVSLTPSCRLYHGSISTDVMLHTTTPNPCGAGNTQCADHLQCVPVTSVCDFINHCSDGSDEAKCGQCDFETGMCGWQDMSVGAYAWERHNGSTTSSLTGPPVDHTSGTANGNYMFIDGSQGGILAGNADLVSPVYGALGSDCQIQFAFHRKGDVQGFLRLYLVPNNVQPTDTAGRILLWSANTQNDSWQMATVGIGARDPGYRLVFEAVKHLQTGDMAIDDVKFVGCKVAPHIGDCAPNQFTCANQACVDNTYVCDYSNDCGDSSDETSCSNYVERCDFETDICNWIQDDSDDFNWEHQSGGTSTIGTGPRLDHTLGTTRGNYIYIETSSPQSYNDKARLKSPVFQATTTGNCRMRLWYYMYGVNINAFHVYKEHFELGPMELAVNITGNQGASWIRLDNPFTSNAPFRVILEAVVGNGFKGDIAIDDISFTPDCQVMSAGATLPAMFTTPSSCGAGKLPCKNGQCIPAMNFCNFRTECSDNSDEANCPVASDFEDGTLDMWTNDINNDFNWTLGSNGNPASLTGPSVDHTSQTSSGKYLFVTGKITTVNRMISRLISPIYSQAGKTCNFTFWYNVHGQEFVNINVYLRRGSKESKLTTVYGASLSDNQDTWQLASASLPICASSFQLILETTSVGAIGLPQGFVAIDDLEFQNCQYPTPPTAGCSPDQFQCSSGHCIDMSQKCDFQTDCCDGSDENAATCSAYNLCDFEYGLCTWEQITSDQFDWQRNRGPTSSYGTGPTQDHTTGAPSGFYLFIESKMPRQVGDKARIALTLPSPKQNCVLRFWYYMYGADTGTLNVYTSSLNDGLQLMSNVAGNQGPQWNQFSTKIAARSSIQVIIEGVIGTGYHGDIAIDDVSLTPECGVPSSLAPPVTHAPVTLLTGSTPKPCPLGQYTCGNGQCIPATSACNGVNDCSDNSDEARCLMPCNFETNQCGWSEVIVDGFDFVRSSAVKATAQGQAMYAPPLDDTRKNQNGFFMFVLDQTGGRTAGKIAMINSPILYSSRQDCKMQFAYYMSGQDVGQLQVEVQEAGSPPVILWRRLGTNGLSAGWRSVTVGLGKHTASFVVSIQKIAGTYNGRSAIDDISYLDCDPPLAKASCNQDEFTCANRACVPQNAVCDMTDDCGDKSDESNCTGYLQTNYEVGFGKYLRQGVDGVEDDFGWWLAPYNRNLTYFPGPPYDHTLETAVGKYLYIDSHRPQYNSRAWLIAGTFQPTISTDCRMVFYLYIYGQNANTFSVNTRIYSSDAFTSTPYMTQGKEKPYWQRISIAFKVAQPFQVRNHS